MRRLVLVTAVLAAAFGPGAARGAEEASPVPCDRFFTGTPPDFECFEVVVPAWHDGRDATTVTLAVVILPSTGSDPARDPVVYLAGGPGASAIATIDLWVASPLREQRDIILVDQRGTLFSTPFLGCPEQVGAELYVSTVAITPEEHVGELATAAAECRARLEAGGIDLAAYSTAASADDLDVVREALGIEQWNLYGISYGTRLGLEILRRHPEGVRSAVLDGLYPPDVDPYRSLAANQASAIGLFFEACRSDSECAARYGDLEPIFWSLVDDLNARPRVLTIPAPGGDMAGTLTGDMLIAQVIGALSSSEGIRWLPAQIAALAGGNLAQYELGSAGLPSGDTADAMRLSIECAERLATIGPDEIAEAAAADHARLATYVARYAEPAICSKWPAAPVDPAVLAAIASDVPIMLVSGELDPLTPPAWADRAAATLPASTVVVVARGGHGPSLGSACLGTVVAAFVNDPERAADGSCALGAQPFRTDLALSPAVPEALVSLISTTSPAPVLPLVLIGAVMAAWLVAASVGIVRRRGRSMAWWVVTGTALTFIVGSVIAFVLVRGIATGPDASVLLLGLPGWAGWLLVLPWLVAALVLATAVAAVTGWTGRFGPRLERVAMTAVALGGVGAVAVLAAYGFLRIT